MPVRFISSLSSTSALLWLARMSGAGLGLLAQLLLARVLSPNALGVFFSVTSAGAVAGLVATLGYSNVTAKFVLRYREQRQPMLVGAFVRQVRRDSWTLAGIFICAFGGFAMLSPALSTEVRMSVVAAAASVPAIMMLRLNGALAGAFRYFGLGFLPDVFIRPLAFLIVISALFLGGSSISTSVVVVLFSGIALASALAQHLILSRKLPVGVFSPKPDRLARMWRAEATPLVTVALFATLFGDLALFIVTPLLTAANVAAFGLCLKLALSVGFAVQVSHLVITPDLAEAHARRDSELPREALLGAASFPVAFTLVATLTAAFAGDSILGFFGPEFRHAHTALTILVGVQFIRAILGPNTSLLTVIGAQKTNTIIAALSLALLAVASAALAPSYGVLGAAIAAALAIFFWSAASAIVLFYANDLRTDYVALLSHGR